MKNLLEIIVLNGCLTQEEKTKVREYTKDLELDVLISVLEKTWASQEN